ncbi:MAG: PBP1A family penicillin-binding protein [Ignavibacteriae bacterium]|nr:PBP1A family penicillin-binding protein [Ignavibacteriota bacterium]
MIDETKKEKSTSESKVKLFLKNKIFQRSALGIVVLLFLIGGYFFYQHIISGLPSLEQLENPQQSLATNVVSADGKVIGSFFRQNRREVKIDSLPIFVIEALVATEDRKYFDHWGVDLERFIKAMIKTVFLGKKEGASTITQQLAKNLYDLKVARENLFQTVVRKIREWFTSVQIEQTYTKREILEMYLNTSFFGNRAYGIEMAAQNYFGKSAKDLKLTEAAVFIALLKSHVYYNPIRRPERSLQRRNVVMYNMREVGFLTDEEYQKLKLEPIELAEKIANAGMQSKIAPHFVEHIRRKLQRMSSEYGFNIYEDGLKVYTTLDTRMQTIANRVTHEHLDEFQKVFDKRWSWKKNRDTLKYIIDGAIKKNEKYKKAGNEEKKKLYQVLKKDQHFIDSVKHDATRIQVAFVALDVTGGEIKAMIGGREKEFSHGLNHVTQVIRQPGSAFKPIIYTAALENGLYPVYPLLNQEFEYGEDNWNPHNFDKSTSGFLTLRDGLRHSVNLIAARLLIEDHVRLRDVGDLAKRLGIKTRLHLVPSLALGTSEVTPLELTSVYATIANKGIYNKPMTIVRIENKDGIVIADFSSQSKDAISEDVAYIITNMLETVIKEGSGMRTRSMYQFYRPAAGKTGTTQDYGDAWFMGFTPQIAAGAWVGFDDRRVTFTGSYGQGAHAANPIWSKFMKGVYDSLDFPEESFEVPSSGNVVSVKFCKESIYEYGVPKLYSEDCSTGEVEDFILMKDLPSSFNAERDSKANIYTKYFKPDSLAHEALEISEAKWDSIMNAN